MDPSNAPLLPHSDHGPTKAEKRKADRAAVREAKKSAKLSRAQGIHANTVDDDEDNQIPTKVRAPLSYPVLNPRAASEQQLLLAQLSHQAPLAAIPVAAHQAQVQAAIPTPTPVAATQLNMQTEIAPNGVEPPLRNPFDTSEAPKKRGGGGSKKQSATAAAAMPQMPMLPFMGMAGMPPFMAQQAAFMQFTAEQQLQLQQQMMQQQQQHGASIPQHDGGNDEPAESLAAAPAAAAAAASSSSPSVAAVYAAAAAASSGQVAAAASSDAAAEPVDPAVQDIIAGNRKLKHRQAHSGAIIL